MMSMRANATRKREFRYCEYDYGSGLRFGMGLLGLPQACRRARAAAYVSKVMAGHRPAAGEVKRSPADTYGLCLFRRGSTCILRFSIAAPPLAGCGVLPASGAGSSVHSSYHWHLHQPIYWPDNILSLNRYQYGAESLDIKTAGGKHLSRLDLLPPPAATGWGHGNTMKLQQQDRLTPTSGGAVTPSRPCWGSPEGCASVSYSGLLMENVNSFGKDSAFGHTPTWKRGADTTARGSTMTSGHPRRRHGGHDPPTTPSHPSRGASCGRRLPDLQVGPGTGWAAVTIRILRDRTRVLHADDFPTPAGTKATSGSSWPTATWPGTCANYLDEAPGYRRMETANLRPTGRTGPSSVPWSRPARAAVSDRTTGRPRKNASRSCSIDSRSFCSSGSDSGTASDDVLNFRLKFL